jgi:hypothetical protein
MGWQPSPNARVELTEMLTKVNWREPIQGYQAQCLRDCAEFVRAGIRDNPFVDMSPVDEALADQCDAVIAVLDEGPSTESVGRVVAAARLYNELAGGLGEN